MRQHLAQWLQLVRLSARLVAGRRFWIAPLLPLLWHGFRALILIIPGTDARDPVPEMAQGAYIGFPLTVLAIGLGVRIIANELERRTLEIAYTVPGGTHRVWIAKLAAAAMILVAAEALLAVSTWAFFTAYPPTALYGALQPALFYLVLSMGFAALFKSEVTGAMATAAVLSLNGFISEWRISPFWNPLALQDTGSAMATAYTVQNRIGFVLAIAAVIALAFARAERREKMLSG
jgi:ABC-type transport system involved in multi-copper enzyme maturation permease subunit